VVSSREGPSSLCTTSHCTFQETTRKWYSRHWVLCFIFFGTGSLALRAPCQERGTGSRRERNPRPPGSPLAPSASMSPQKPGGPEDELPPSLLVSTVLGSVVLLLRLSRFSKSTGTALLCVLHL